MTRLLSILLFLTTFTARGQVSWYRSFSGTIDKYPVTIHLHKAGLFYSGYYYYNSSQQPMYFIGDDTTVAGKINLLVFLPDRERDENLTFSITGRTVSGLWTNSSSKKSLAFKGSEDTPTPGWDYVFTTGSVKLRPAKKNSPEATYESASVWPKANTVSTEFIKKIINRNFGEKNSTVEIGKTMLKQKKQFLSDYLSEYKDVKDEEIGENSYGWNMDETNRLMVVFQSKTILTLANFGYSYTGGAHGNYGSGFIPIDLLNQKELKLEDILTSAGRDQLPALLEKYFRKTYNLKDEESLGDGGLFEDKIEPNDNFFVTSKGIGFNYVPYEIGPYAMGEITVFIPFTELAAYLQPGFKKLL